MLASLGHFILIIIALLNILCICSKIFSVFGASYISDKLNLNLALPKFILSLISFLILIYCFYISDFSVLLVVKHSTSLTPTLYKITSSWGNHEGSMLMWLVELSFINFLFSKSQIGKKISAQILIIQYIIELLFLVFVINYSNPFEASRNYSEGYGLNPILQDIGLAIHPPILYFGYAVLSLPFSYCIISLISGEFKEDVVKKLQPWINFSWAFISLGIMLGSWWAYRELGWGGFWFWDPVENISLMPWLVSTALLHTTIVVIKQKNFFNWFCFLSILAFCLSLVGSFLVRSGILISVHSFAVDSHKGLYLLLILAMISICSSIIYIIRMDKIPKDNRIFLFSKESSILLNNILFTTASLTILLSILYPIIYQLSGKTISVGEGYFKTCFLPIIALIMFFMSFTSDFKWGENSKVKPSKYIEIISAILISFYICHSTQNYNPRYIMFLSVSILLIITMTNIVIKKLYLGERKLYIFSMLIAHLMIGVAAFSVCFNIYNSLENSIYLEEGESTKIGAYNIILKEIEYQKDENYYTRKAKFLITSNNQELAYIYPEFRFYEIEDTTTYEADMYHSILCDLYIVIGEMREGKLTVRIYYKPLMSFLWSSIILMVIPVLLNLFMLKKENVI